MTDVALGSKRQTNACNKVRSISRQAGSSCSMEVFRPRLLRKPFLHLRSLQDVQCSCKRPCHWLHGKELLLLPSHLYVVFICFSYARFLYLPTAERIFKCQIWSTHCCNSVSIVNCSLHLLSCHQLLLLCMWLVVLPLLSLLCAFHVNVQLKNILNAKTTENLHAFPSRNVNRYKEINV